MSKRKPPSVPPLSEKLLRKLTAPVPERLRKLVAPVPEKLRDWVDSQVERELRAIARQFAQPNDLQSQPPKRKRRKGAGAPPKLTPEKIVEGRDLLRRALRKRPTLGKSVAAMKEVLRTGLKAKVSVDTLWRRIVLDDEDMRRLVARRRKT